MSPTSNFCTVPGAAPTGHSAQAALPVNINGHLAAMASSDHAVSRYAIVRDAGAAHLFAAQEGFVQALAILHSIARNAKHEHAKPGLLSVSMFNLNHVSDIGSKSSRFQVQQNNPF